MPVKDLRTTRTLLSATQSPIARPKTCNVLLSAIAAFVLALTAIPAPAHAQKKAPAPAATPKADTVSALPQTLILFDNSGSMWGKLKGAQKPKFEIAASSLSAALATVPNTPAKPGLIVFGGRCSTAPRKITSGPDALTQINAMITGLNPKGKGPISNALDTAAKTLQTGTRSSVIVIHDGPDNCKRDPCKTAKAFAKSHTGIPIHLVSIALPKAARIATACVAKLTGGTVTQVKTPDQLTAAIQKVVTLAMHAPPPTKAEPETAQPNAGDKPDTSADKIGPSRLRLSARLGPKGNLLQTPVRWKVFHAGDNPADGKTTPKAPPLLDIAQARFTMPLKPGSYSVTSNVGLLSQRHDVTVADKGATILDVIFDAGNLRLNAPAQPAAPSRTPTLEGPATIVTVTHAAPVNAASTATIASNAVVAPIVVSPGRTTDMILPTGTYRIDTQKGAIRAEQRVEIAAGKTTAIDLNMGTGELKLGLKLQNGSLRDSGVLFQVFTDDPDAKSGRREIARTAVWNPTLTLPQGAYYVTASIGLANAKTRVTISKGTTTTSLIDFPAARLNLQTHLNIAGQASALPVQYRITKMGIPSREIARSGKPDPTFVLNPGKYRIVAEIGARNVTAKAEVELPAGSTTQVKLNPRAGEVVLQLAGKSNAATVGRFWVVRDRLGKIVWRTNAYAPSALLAPGSYEVSCEIRSGKLKKKFELTAGESKAIELTTR